MIIGATGAERPPLLTMPVSLGDALRQREADRDVLALAADR